MEIEICKCFEQKQRFWESSISENIYRCQWGGMYNGIGVCGVRGEAEHLGGAKRSQICVCYTLRVSARTRERQRPKSR